jgi:hypothetical protein
VTGGRGLRPERLAGFRLAGFALGRCFVRLGFGLGFGLPAGRAGGGGFPPAISIPKIPARSSSARGDPASVLPAAENL